jgi:hypothetical protein
MGGDVVLMMPRDASFTLNARVSEKNDIISDFPLEVPSGTPSGSGTQAESSS